MDFFSETKFNAPIKGQNNESGNPELNILGGVSVASVGGSPVLSIADHKIDVSVAISSTKSINTSDSITADGSISAVGNIDGGSISTCGDITANGTISGGAITTSGNITGGSISTCGDITASGSITAKSITSQCSINTMDLNASGMITSGMIQANGDIIAASTTIRGRYLVAGGGGIELGGETITSWAELKGPAGPSIQRFTSPELPANCSQFYFEGCNLVTGTELPFIQVRETATGKLVQMDVWVNLDGCCSGYTVGKPVANIQPCSTATDAGAWTAIVMN